MFNHRDGFMIERKKVMSKGSIPVVRVKMSDVNEHLTDDEIKEINAAKKRPIKYDEDSPKMTKNMLDQFHGFDFGDARA